MFMNRIFRTGLLAALFVALAGAQCNTGSTPETSDYWAFRSDRTEREDALVARNQKALAPLLSGTAVRWHDPLALHALISGVRSSTAVTPRARDAAHLALNHWSEIETYIHSLITATERFENIAALVRASRLNALAEQLDAPGNTDASALQTTNAATRFTSAWARLSGAVLSNAWEHISPPSSALRLVGSDCGEAPPADGSMPPMTADQPTLSALNDWASNIDLATLRNDRQWTPPLPLNKAAAELATDHMSHMLWFAAYRGLVPHLTTADAPPRPISRFLLMPTSLKCVLPSILSLVLATRGPRIAIPTAAHNPTSRSPLKNEPSPANSDFAWRPLRPST